MARAAAAFKAGKGGVRPGTFEDELGMGLGLGEEHPLSEKALARRSVLFLWLTFGGNRRVGGLTWIFSSLTVFCFLIDLLLPTPLTTDEREKNRGYQSHLLFKHPFHLSTRWTSLRPLGQGAYGLVVSAEDTISGEKIAIKLLTRVFGKVILARRCLREITLLRHLNGHENVSRESSV
jgi:hypothetical protein